MNGVRMVVQASGIWEAREKAAAMVRAYRPNWSRDEVEFAIATPPTGTREIFLSIPEKGRPHGWPS